LLKNYKNSAFFLYIIASQIKFFNQKLNNMINWKTALITVGLTLLALAIWDSFLRKPVLGLLKKGDEPPVT